MLSQYEMKHFELELFELSESSKNDNQILWPSAS